MRKWIISGGDESKIAALPLFNCLLDYSHLVKKWRIDILSIQFLKVQENQITKYLKIYYEN